MHCHKWPNNSNNQGPCTVYELLQTAGQTMWHYNIHRSFRGCLFLTLENWPKYTYQRASGEGHMLAGKSVIFHCPYNVLWMSRVRLHWIRSNHCPDAEVWSRVNVLSMYPLTTIKCCIDIPVRTTVTLQHLLKIKGKRTCQSNVQLHCSYNV